MGFGVASVTPVSFCSGISFLQFSEKLQKALPNREIVKEKRSIRNRMQASAIASCVFVALLIAVCCFLPRITVMPENAGMWQYGSLLLAAPYVGYVMVGTLAFALGVCVTLLCIHYKALKQKERDRT